MIQSFHSINDRGYSLLRYEKILIGSLLTTPEDNSEVYLK